LILHFPSDKKIFEICNFVLGISFRRYYILHTFLYFIYPKDIFMTKTFSSFLPAVMAATCILTSGTAFAADFLVSDGATDSIERIDSGVASAFITNSQYLDDPTGLAVNGANDVFVANGGNGNISKFSATGKFLGYYSLGQDSPAGITLDSNGDLFVADEGNGTVVEFAKGSPYDSSGTVVASGLGTPDDLGFSKGVLYVTDGKDDSVDVVSGGVATPFISTHLSDPTGIAFAKGTADILVVNHATGQILKFRPNGTYLGIFATDSQTGAELTDITVGPLGDVWVTDTGNNTVLDYNNNGVLKHVRGKGSLDDPGYITQYVVPEPSTYALLAAGLGLLCFLGRVKRARV
jgi:hypothetical protein